MFITLYVGLLLCDKDGRSVHRVGLGGGYIPRRWRPQPQRTQTDYTRQAAARPCQMQGRPPTAGRAPTHTPERCTGLHSIPDRPRRVDQDGGRCWTVCNVFGKVYNFGRLFLSIFIWTYFAESIDNPYIYGYNIISPDKYGLQPH